MITAKEQQLLKKGEGHTKFEVNFAIKKFLELPPPEKEKIFANLYSEDKEEYAAAGYALLSLILDNLEEMASFVTPALDLWIIWPEDQPYKAHYLWLYFKANLKKDDRHEYTIQPIK